MLFAKMHKRIPSNLMCILDVENIICGQRLLFGPPPRGKAGWRFTEATHYLVPTLTN